MAEGGIFDKLIGNDEFEQPESSELAEEYSAEALAVALAAERYHPESDFSRKAAEYLDRQRELTALNIGQFDHFHAQTTQQLDLAIRAAKRKAISDHLRLVVQVVLAFIPLFLVAAIAVMVYGAVTAHSVVVDAFQAPAALAPSGVTGQVVATGILDELDKLQDSTRTLEGSQLATKSAWSSEVKIEVPETGVSIGEVDRLLRVHLGHDIHIDGDLIQTPTGGLALTVRGDDVLPKTFTGTAADLDKLTSQAAEYIYGRSQPYQYANYLMNRHRDAESVEFIQGAFERAHDDALRAQLANGWGNALQDMNRSAEAFEKYHLAILLQPHYWTPRGNAVSALAGTLGEEAAWQESRAMILAGESAPKNDKPRAYMLENPAAITWDMPLALTAYLDDASRNNGAGASTTTVQSGVATLYAEMHDAPSAARYLALSDPKAPETQWAADQIALMQANDRNDPAAAVSNADSLWKVWQANTQLQSGDDSPCLAALAFGMAGRTADSDAIFQKLGPWSRCTAAHGQILERQGNLAAAEAAWADGIAHSPDLPAVYLARGLSEENRGDLHAAEADFAHASTNAPHFADPLKLYGDLLAREGRWKEALAKYDEALKYAPNWPTLHQARDQAAHKN